MIPVKPRAEPNGFDIRCRKRGRRWLDKHPDYEGRPRDYWSEFEPDLRRVFRGLCGYCAMMIPRGQIDHFIPIAVLRRRKQDVLAYEWTNYRYAAADLNQVKAQAIILDPFSVADDWFQIRLPSLQLTLTSNVPRARRRLAEFSIERLGLRDGEFVVRYRREWFELYQRRELTFDGLVKMAPLIAKAVQRDLDRGKDWRL